MKIIGEHAFQSPRERVWEALQDPQMLANALPGVKRLEVTGADEYAITVSVGVGSVKGTYDGTFKLSDKQDTEACSVRANATGGPGSVDAVARMQMRDGDDGGAVLTYDAVANVTGPLAGVGQRLIGGAARKTTKEFLTALDRQLVSPAPTDATDGATPADGQPAPAAQAAPARGAVFAPSGPAASERPGTDPLVVAVSALAGFLLALVGIAFGRWTARH
jgi:carbon monoxide dehydrogenase subunit G